MVGYVYITINKVNNKKYIGKHKSNKFNPSYLGSGLRLADAINKYGAQNFEVNIIQKCYTIQELNDAEIYYISKHKAVEREEYYNISYGGDGVNIGAHSEETKRKIGKANSGKKRTPEMIAKNREYRLGARWMNKDEEQEYVFKQFIEDRLQDGWNFGTNGKRKLRGSHSEETKKKISKAHKGTSKPRTQVNKQIKSLKKRKFHWYTDGFNNLHIAEGEHVPENFYRGRYIDEETRKKNSETNRKRLNALKKSKP